MNGKQVARFLLSASLAFWAVGPGPVGAQEEPGEDAPEREGEGLLPDHEGEVSARGIYHTDFENAGKFLEYRDVPQGGALDLLEFGNRRRSEDEYYYRVRGQDVARKDQRVDIELGHYGYYDLDVRWDRILHRFGTDGITLYRGLGSGRLVLDDAVQRDVHLTTGAVAAARLGNHLDESQHLGLDDTSLQRDRIDGSLDWYQFDPLRLSLDVDFERRNGVRPTFGSFGFNHTEELLEPIDYQTFNVRGAIGVAQGPIDVEAHYRFGYFDNGERSLTWDNPFRIVDTTAQAATGRMALEADNYVNEVGVKAGFDVAERTRISGRASVALHRSEVDLLPWTTNSTIRPGVPGAGNPPFDASDEGTLPDDRFDGEVLTQSYDLALTSRPWDPFELELFGRYFIRNHMSEQDDFVGKVRGDGSWTTFAAPEVPQHQDYSRGVGGIETTFHMEALRSRLKPGYEFTILRRDPESRHVDRSYEHAASLDLQTDWNRWVSTEVGVGTSFRDARDHRDFMDPQLRFLRRFDVIDRNRFEFHVESTLTPIDGFQTALGYKFRRDDYDADFGLEEAEWQQLFAQSTISPSGDVDVTLFYAHDRFDTTQHGRQWNPGSIADPYVNPFGVFKDNNSNWTAEVEERVHTIGFHPTWRFAAQWSMTGGYAFAYSETRIDLKSRMGSAADDLNPYEPVDLRSADDSHRHTVHFELRYVHSDWLEIYAGYGYDFYRSDSDFDRRVTSVPQLPSGNFAGVYYLGLDHEDAEVHVTYLGATLRF